MESSCSVCLINYIGQSNDALKKADKILTGSEQSSLVLKYVRKKKYSHNYAVCVS